MGKIAKPGKGILYALLGFASIVVVLGLLHAQTFLNGGQSRPPDSFVQVAAESQGLAQVAPEDLPRGGTYWWVMPNGCAVPTPFLPRDLNGPVYQITDVQFLVDTTGGQVALNSSQFRLQRQTTANTVATVVAAHADAVVNLINQIQTREYARQVRAMAMAMGVPMPGGGFAGGSGGGSVSSFAWPIMTTNDLWLEIITVTNNTASLVIHPPWNVTNAVYDLLYTTNLLNPMATWQWLLRSNPGQTNLLVANANDDQGFYRLRNPNAIRPDYTNNVLDANDDGSTDLLPIGFAINFFGTTYSNLYVNNNGNITFDSPLSSYTPYQLIDLGLDIIAPFWADVDTRGAGSSVMTYGTNTVDGHAAFGVSWINVGYFNNEDDKLNSFQLVLIDRSDRTNGDFDLEFNYSQIQWETGDFSGGSDGLGGSSARAGYASANAGLWFELNGSGTNSAFLDTNTVTGLINTNYNSDGVLGRYVYQFHNGTNILAHP